MNSLSFRVLNIEYAWTSVSFVAIYSKNISRYGYGRQSSPFKSSLTKQSILFLGTQISQNVLHTALFLCGGHLLDLCPWMPNRIKRIPLPVHTPSNIWQLSFFALHPLFQWAVLFSFPNYKVSNFVISRISSAKASVLPLIK